MSTEFGGHPNLNPYWQYTITDPGPDQEAMELGNYKPFLALSLHIDVYLLNLFITSKKIGKMINF